MTYLLLNVEENEAVSVETLAEASKLVMDETHEPDVSCAREVYQKCADIWFDHYADLDDPDRNADAIFPSYIYDNCARYCDGLWEGETAEFWSRHNGGWQRRTIEERL